MDKKQPKPCPFCGEKAELETFWDPYARCKSRGATGKIFDNVDHAIKAWNRRAALPSDAAQTKPVATVRV